MYNDISRAIDDILSRYLIMRTRDDVTLYSRTSRQRDFVITIHIIRVYRVSNLKHHRDKKRISTRGLKNRQSPLFELVPPRYVLSNADRRLRYARCIVEMCR